MGSVSISAVIITHGKRCISENSLNDVCAHRFHILNIFLEKVAVIMGKGLYAVFYRFFRRCFRYDCIIILVINIFSRKGDFFSFVLTYIYAFIKVNQF